MYKLIYTVIISYATHFLVWTIFVEIGYLTKSTFGLGNAVCNILWGETLLIAAAKSFILNGI